MSPSKVYSTIMNAQGLGSAYVRIKLRGDDSYVTGYATTGSGVSAANIANATFHLELVEPGHFKRRVRFGDVEDIEVIEP